MKNKEIIYNNKQELKVLEQNYINTKIGEMSEYIENQKEKIVNELIVYSKEHIEPTKWDKDGNVLKKEVIMNPVVITNYFFKPITNLSNIEPQYSSEQLGMVYDYYCFIIAEINDKVGNFPPSLTSFCKLASITLSTLRKYKNSPDINMRIITEKIYDQIGDNNLTLSQLGITKEKTTQFRLKVENEVVEKTTPNINYNVSAKLDLAQINQRLSEITNFNQKLKGDK